MSAIIVDDNKEVCEAFAEYLKMEGIRVLGVAHDGKSGAKTFRKVRPDIVFLDVAMPEYDGYYALRSIRDCDQDAFVVVLTACNYEDVEERTRDVRPDGIIIKPCNTRKLRQIIEARKAALPA